MESRNNLVFKFKSNDASETAVNNIRRYIEQIAQAHKEIPKDVEDWNSLLSTQQNLMKDITLQIDAIKGHLKDAYSESAKASTGTNISLQKEIQLLEKRLQLRQRDYAEAAKARNDINSVIDAQKRLESASKSGSSRINMPPVPAPPNPLRPQPHNPLEPKKQDSFLLERYKDFARGGLPGVVEGAAGAGLSGSIKGLASKHPVGAAIAAIGAAAFGMHKTLNWAFDKATPARSYVEQSQEMSYRYRLGQDLSDWTTKTTPGKKGIYSDKEMMEQMYPALAQSTGSMYLEGANRDKYLPMLAEYSRKQGMTFDETAKTLSVAKEGGMITHTGAGTENSLAVLTNAMVSGTKLGFDRSERLSQLQKVIQFGNKDLGAIYKDTGKNMVAELRAFEKSGMRGVVGDRAAEMLSNTKGMLGDMPIQRYASMQMMGMLPDMEEAAIKNLAETHGGDMDKARETYQGMTPAQRMQMQRQALLTSDQSLPAMSKLIKDFEGNEGMLGMMLKGGELNDKEQMQWADFVMGVKQGKFDKDALAAVMGEQEKMPADKGVAHNVQAEKSEKAKFLKDQVELTGALVALDKTIDMQIGKLNFELNALNKLFGNSAKENANPNEKPYTEATPVGRAMNKLETSANKPPLEFFKDILKHGATATKEAVKETYPETKKAYEYVAPKASGAWNTMSKWMQKGWEAVQPHVAEAQAAHPEIPKAFINAVIRQESQFKTDAKSKVGAGGLMQLMPETAKGLGVKDVNDPAQNIKGGVKHLAYLWKKFDGDPEKVLRAYNWGHEAKVAKGHKGPKETQEYVPKIMGYYEEELRREQEINEANTANRGMSTHGTKKEQEVAYEYNKKHFKHNTKTEEQTNKAVKKHTSTYDMMSTHTPVSSVNMKSNDKKTQEFPLLKDAKKEVYREKLTEKLVVPQLQSSHSAPPVDRKSQEKVEKIYNKEIVKTEKQIEKEKSNTVRLSEESAKQQQNANHSGNSGVNISTLHVGIPGFTVNQQGRDKLKETFEHHLVPLPNSNGKR